MSIELTDDIRELHFSQPIKPEEMKYYTEHFALAVLRYCFDEYDSWIASDAPDLQSPDGAAGIEVTELAISLNRAIVGDCLHYWETGDERYKAKAEHRGARPGEEFYILPSVDSGDEFAALETIFRKKLSKLTGYKKRGIEKLGLIMVMDGLPLPATAENWADVVRVLQSGSEERYDKVFFTYSSVLSYYNSKTDTMTNYPIDKNDYEALGKYARLMVESR
jgi:hypothetical protein